MRTRPRDATLDEVVNELRYAVDNGGANGARCNLWANDLAEIAARLAADQQKGGGEVDDTVFIQQTRCYPGDEWFREMTVEGVQFLVPLDQQEQARFILSAKKRRTTPQPSIPAPAQQGPVVDEAVRS